MAVARPQGLYRIKGVAGQPDEVWISDAGLAHSIPEDDYKQRRLEPPVEDLPASREDYFARPATAEKPKES
jgi:hypothetical protein